jgi:anti-anti-sigma factor
MPVVVEVIRPRVYRITGELDASNVGDVEHVFGSVLASDGDVTLNLSELTFIDSLGVSLFFAVAKRLIGKGDLVLVSPQDSVRTVLEMVQVRQLPNIRIG